MRLIDADALRKETFWSGPLDGYVLSLPSLDAAPTVECAACEHHDAVDRRASCAICECGDEFKRRQP